MLAHGRLGDSAFDFEWRAENRATSARVGEG